MTEGRLRAVGEQVRGKEVGVKDARERDAVQVRAPDTDLFA